MKKNKVILGVDPGTVITGFGLIEVIGNHFKLIEYGAIKPNPKDALPQKYLHIHNGIEALIAKHNPDALSVETQFVQKNVQTAIKLGMARGSIIIAAAKSGIEIHEYTPMVAKRAVTGSGRSSKSQVQHMVKALLALKEIPTPEDAADALALAIAHANQTKGAFA
tara:strand:- start:21 stop:515 length:495 start_codon:yes stop_codon:yes gene_type:complete